MRRNTYTTTTAANPPLPPRRPSLSTGPAAQTAYKAHTQAHTSPLHVQTITLSGAMDSRYNRPASPHARYANSARASTGTFADAYYDYAPTSSAYYTTPASSTGSRAANLKYDAYSTPARPRRSTIEHGTRPNPSSLTTTALPLDTYSPPTTARTSHKKVYSVDDSSHATRLVADVETPRRRDAAAAAVVADRPYNLTSGGRTYHTTTKAPSRLIDLADSDYSYTDPASMYRDTEPAWRRPRAGSLDRRARPTSMVVDRPVRSSTREQGPPPSTRGFGKINTSFGSSIPSRSHGRTGSVEKAYEHYPESVPALPARATSTHHRAPAAIHQEPREHRRDTYHDDYDCRDRDTENRRLTGSNHFEDHNVAARGFGIAPGIVPVSDQHTLDRQPIWPAAEAGRARPPESASQYYQPDRAEARMPEPRLSRGRDSVLAQDGQEKRQREREASSNGNFVPAAAGAAAGVAAGVAAGYIKSREKDRVASDRDSSGERERERRREYDERDRRDRVEGRRDERRERRSDERRDALPPPQLQPSPPAAIAPAVSSPAIPGAYPSPPDTDRRVRERRRDEDDRDRSSRKQHSSEGSGDERPRHYVGRDAARPKESTSKEAALDPDEEYRRRVQQEAERGSRGNRDRDSDSDRERDRRRRERSRDPEDRARASALRDVSSSRYDERPSSVYGASVVQEPESLDRDGMSKSTQIVTPPKEAPPPVKGILRKPTSKFPEDPEPIREGVAPHKDALKGKDIPVGARWTRIDRRLVNPEALEQAKERFEERMDCVIVLRVLTKEDIQKLADRTRKIREQREDEYERRDREERSKRNSRDTKDDRDDDRDREYRRERERRRRYNDDDDDSDYDAYDHRDRERSKAGN